MALIKWTRVAALASVVIFLVLLFLSLSRSGDGPWHGHMVELWQKQEWYAIKSLAENLYQAGIRDREALFLAMLASQELQNTSGVQLFAERLLAQKPLNWKMEVVTSHTYNVSSPLKKALFYRTRLLLLILSLLAVTMAWSFYKHRTSPIWIGGMALLGSAVVLL